MEVNHMATSNNEPSRKKTAGGKKAAANVLEIEVFLAKTKPRIWRRFEVRDDITLAKLHDVLQAVMGWYDCHLHQFRDMEETRYGPRDDDMDPEWDADVIEERTVKLRDVMPKVGSRLLYEYDFGDDWVHGLEVVKVGPVESGTRYPRCLSGERACPPEDVGGVYGFYEMLEALANPKHEEHDSYLEWLGGEYDPQVFDLKGVNELLRSIR
jgi:hypothetical protein